MKQIISKAILFTLNRHSEINRTFFIGGLKTVNKIIMLHNDRLPISQGQKFD